MPRIVHMDDAVLSALEDQGGLKPNTLSDRKAVFSMFEEYIREETGEEIHDLLVSEEGRVRFESEFGRYFFKMRVTSKVISIISVFISFAVFCDKKKLSKLVLSCMLHCSLSPCLCSCAPLGVFINIIEFCPKPIISRILARRFYQKSFMLRKFVPT